MQFLRNLGGEPEECRSRSACVFNGGIFGFCMCHEHYHVRHGRADEREAYYTKHPERRGKVVHIEDEHAA